MTTEAVVLTGGKSSRMGEDKAHILLPDGRTILERTLQELDRAGLPVTVLGREPVPGRAFLQDEGDHQGPAHALRRFAPTQDAVLVVACDLPAFDARCVPVMQALLEGHDAVVPSLAGRPQPLCALYRAAAFAKWRASDARSMHALLALLDVRELREPELLTLGIQPASLRDVDTPADLDRLKLPPQ